MNVASFAWRKNCVKHIILEAVKQKVTFRLWEIENKLTVFVRKAMVSININIFQGEFQHRFTVACMAEQRI